MIATVQVGLEDSSQRRRYVTNSVPINWTGSTPGHAEFGFEAMHSVPAPKDW